MSNTRWAKGELKTPDWKTRDCKRRVCLLIYASPTQQSLS